MAQVGRANLVRGAIRRSEQLSLDGTFDNGGDILEDITLCENVAAGANLKGMTSGVIPVVVDLRW